MENSEIEVPSLTDRRTERLQLNIGLSRSPKGRLVVVLTGTRIMERKRKYSEYKQGALTVSDVGLYA